MSVSVWQSESVTTNMPGRMLRLLALLQSRREWSGTELADRLGVTGRTVRRDIDRLRELGYPVEGTTGTAGGYHLASGRNLPPLLLDDEEAVAVAVGLLTAAGGSVTGTEEMSLRALVKLQQVLPARLRRQVDAFADAIVPVVRRNGPQVDPSTLAVVAAACRDQESLSFGYQRRDGTASTRRVEPHTLVSTHGLWYLVAHDVDRAGWRTFRIDRLTSPVPTGRRFTPRELPTIDAATYVARNITAAPYRYTVRATVDAPAETVLARTASLIPGRVEPVDEHTCTVHVGADTPEFVITHLVALGADFALDDAPPELLDHLQTAGQRLIDAARQ